MKQIKVCLTSLFFFLCCHAQNMGTITTYEVRPKAGITNHYFYHPPKILLLPITMQALVLYQSNKQFFRKYLPLSKVGNVYQFEFKAPDSISVLIMGIVDGKVKLSDYSGLSSFKKKIVDNNSDAGFVFYLYNNKGKRAADRKIQLASLLQSYQAHGLDIKITNASLIKLYEDDYKLQPELKKEDSYADYLAVLYEEKKNLVKPQLLLYANKLERIENNEPKWLNAVEMYRILKMDDEKKVLSNKILSIFPSGELAKKNFWDNFYKHYKDNTGLSILDSMNYYIRRFNDSSSKIKDIFYSQIISKLLDEKDWVAITKYENLIPDKIYLEDAYNNFAWKLSGKQIDNTGSDLEIAKMLSKKAIASAEERIKNLPPYDEYYDDGLGAHNKYINTYALILYKLGQCDSAFYYQDAMYQRGNELNVDGLDRYAVYAEKVKGAQYARQVLEQQLIRGVQSPAMLQQLQSIYKQLNLPADGFKNLQEKSTLLARQKAATAIRKKLGTTKAMNFTLKNIVGQTVSLSSFKGKVVVLDFWATWCGPCIASFPAMQEAINQYKEDSSVVFLFIDVWEHKLPQKMQQSTAKFIKDGNYDFNVLLDINDKVVSDYKITDIPAKFVIDKKGDVIFMSETSNITLEIEAAKN